MSPWPFVSTALCLLLALTLLSGCATPVGLN